MQLQSDPVSSFPKSMNKFNVGATSPTSEASSAPWDFGPGVSSDSMDLPDDNFSSKGMHGLGGEAVSYSKRGGSRRPGKAYRFCECGDLIHVRRARCQACGRAQVLRAKKMSQSVTKHAGGRGKEKCRTISKTRCPTFEPEPEVTSTNQFNESVFPSTTSRTAVAEDFGSSICADPHVCVYSPLCSSSGVFSGILDEIESVADGHHVRRTRQPPSNISSDAFECPAAQSFGSDESQLMGRYYLKGQQTPSTEALLEELHSLLTAPITVFNHPSPGTPGKSYIDTVCK